MGGVLFSLEGMSSFFPPKTMIRAFFCALVSSVTLQLIDPYRGKRVLYQVTLTRDWNFHEIFYFVILGIFGGLSGAFFIRANSQVQQFLKSNIISRISPIKFVVFLTFITSLLGFLNTFTR
jgi:chloride channel 3/4/5